MTEAPAALSTTDVEWFDELCEVVESFSLFAVPSHWPHEAKVIHDAVWGTRELDGWEVALLDLPVLQRLRQIHQTSLAYLTFPTAIHTRFDHSLGVIVIAKEMLQRLELNQDAHLSATVRAAAMLHDIGHGPFSHLTEEAYGVFSNPFDKILYMDADGGTQPLYLGAKPHEAIGALMLRSPSAFAFFDALNNEYRMDLDPAVLGDVICGKGIPDALHYSGIVNGQFDADKVDYLHRDSLFSGIPISIDLHRFLYSLDIGKTKRGRILAMTERGAIPAEQILFGKATMFSGMYHHRKVRAADCAYKSLVERLIESGSTIAGRRLHSPADFLALSDHDFLSRNIGIEDEVAQSLLMDIVDRRLSVGVLRLDRNSVGVTPGEEPTRPENLWSLLPGDEAHRHSQYKAVLEVRKEIVKGLGGAGSAVDPLALGRLWVDIPHVPTLGTASLMVRGRDMTPEFTSTFPAEQWADIYKTHRYQGHVFAPRQIADAAQATAKSVLSNRFATKF